MLRKFKYNHIVWFHYHVSKLGFDCYCAKFASPLPHKLPKIETGKWFVDLRFYQWQFAISKVVHKPSSKTSVRTHTPSISFNNPTFGL